MAFLVGLLAFTGLASVAAAHTRGCGDVITANEELHNDIGPCHGDGLVVRGSNITVDLNGRKIFGEGGWWWSTRRPGCASWARATSPSPTARSATSTTASG